MYVSHGPYIEAITDALDAAGLTVADWNADENDPRDAYIEFARQITAPAYGDDTEVNLLWREDRGWMVGWGDADSVPHNGLDWVVDLFCGVLPTPEEMVAEARTVVAKIPGPRADRTAATATPGTTTASTPSSPLTTTTAESRRRHPMAMGETPITITGNLTSDPELKFTASGAAMAKFTVASTPRSYDRESGQYRDGTSMFMRCSAGRHLAEHVTESLTKGMRVIVSGRLRQLDWQTDQGENRSMLLMEVDDIGPSLTFATASVTKSGPRNSGGKPANGGDVWNADPGPGTGGGEATPF